MGIHPSSLSPSPFLLPIPTLFVIPFLSFLKLLRIKLLLEERCKFTAEPDESPAVKYILLHFGVKKNTFHTHTDTHTDTHTNLYSPKERQREKDNNYLP